MTRNRIVTSLILAATMMGLGACNMYVIDFENKLPNGSVLAPKAEAVPPPPPEPVEPIEGSLDVAFMDSTTAQLEGCRVITGMRLAHVGPFDEGIVRLRNTAVTVNANRIIPLRFIESAADSAPHYYSAKMVRCPDKTNETQMEAANG